MVKSQFKSRVIFLTCIEYCVIFLMRDPVHVIFLTRKLFHVIFLTSIIHDFFRVTSTFIKDEFLDNIHKFKGKPQMIFEYIFYFNPVTKVLRMFSRIGSSLLLEETGFQFHFSSFSPRKAGSLLPKTKSNTIHEAKIGVI